VINLLTTCYVQMISDLLEQLVASLLAEQHCYKSAAGLLQLVRFYVCTQCTIKLVVVYFEYVNPVVR
jgi:hypothetical protein